MLHFYDAGGEETLNCDLGTENKYTLCDINSDSSSVVLSVIAEGAEGLMLLDAKTGKAHLSTSLVNAGMYFLLIKHSFVLSGKTQKKI